MYKRINFTTSAIASQPLPEKGQRIILTDTRITGLQCRVSSTGIKTFSLFRRAKYGPIERITLGRFPEMTVEMARRAAERINGEIARGLNPGESRRSVRDEMTFDELFSEYIEKFAKQHKKTWRSDVNNYKRHLKKALGNKKLSHIARSDCSDIHAKIASEVKRVEVDGTKIYKSGTTANRILCLIASVFSWAISEEHAEKNPAKGIKKFKERSRRRFLLPDELPAFFTSLWQEENHTIRDIILICLLTGARRGNVLSMRWEDISFAAKTWFIPDTKNGEALSLPLTEEALQILDARRNNQIYVFPGDGLKGYLTEPKKGWRRILDRAGIKNLRVHDLRRTLASWQARTNTSLLVIGRTLGHKSPQSTAVYAHLDLEPVRNSMEIATKAIFSAAQSQEQKLEST